MFKPFQSNILGKKMLSILGILLAGFMILGANINVASAKPNKVQICKLNDQGVYMVLEIAEPAVPAHVANGALIVGVDVDENCDPLIVDTDGDGVADDIDNCVDVPNPGQEDSYGSTAGDACEDSDGNGTPDAQEAHFCISIDGVLVISQGTAVCDSTPTTGSAPNVALATGNQAKAYAGTNSVSPFEGSNIQASALGEYAYAVGGGFPPWGYDGANLTVIADGPGTYATAIPSSNTSSIARSTELYNRASSQANYCKDCSSLANGNGANTAAGNGTNNNAEANGVGSYAWARLGNNNTATANGDGASATAHWGSNNTATSTDAYTCAGGTGSGSTADNITAINGEDKCN